MRQVTILFTLFVGVGTFLTFFGFMGLLSLHLLEVLFLIICLLFFLVATYYFSHVHYLSKDELLLSYALLMIWALHFLQVLVPETGFDALWYHLPVIDSILQAEKMVYIPNLYQSVNPLFSDLFFLTGYSVFGIVGAKLIAFFFSVLLVLASYSTARLFVSKKFSLLIVILISTFQVVAWQSASFYVDVAKAFFEMCGLLVLLQYSEKAGRSFAPQINKIYSLLFFSASLATKVFSLLLVPTFILIFGVKDFFSKRFFLHALFLFGIPLLYYFFAYANTGNFLYSVSIHTNKLQEISGESSPVMFIFRKIISTAASLPQLILARDYVNPFLPFVFFPIFIHRINIWANKKLRILFLFSLTQWLVWWFVPPLSTRYALSGFITLLILGVTIIVQFSLTNQNMHKKFVVFLLLVSLIAIVPRILVANRSLKYILGFQTHNQYLQQFYDGSIDEKIDNWYKKTK